MSHPIAKTVVTTVEVLCPVCGEPQSPVGPDGSIVISEEMLAYFPSTFDCAFCATTMSRPATSQVFGDEREHH